MTGVSEGGSLGGKQPRPRRRGHSALRHAPPAPEQAQGGLQPRSASANWRVCPAWPAMPGLFCHAGGRSIRTANPNPNPNPNAGGRSARLILTVGCTRWAATSSWEATATGRRARCRTLCGSSSAPRPPRPPRHRPATLTLTLTLTLALTLIPTLTPNPNPTPNPNRRRPATVGWTRPSPRSPRSPRTRTAPRCCRAAEAAPLHSARPVVAAPAARVRWWPPCTALGGRRRRHRALAASSPRLRPRRPRPWTPTLALARALTLNLT